MSDDVVVWVMVEQVETGLQECSLEMAGRGRAQKDRIGSAIVGGQVGGDTTLGGLDLLYLCIALLLESLVEEGRSRQPSS